ncbi:glycerophosphoryl diester phosphodiesterase membrane domain-containing protein [Luteipulveratus mongoliensis]|uniref:glycerophosphoryl diester phosphodiesterase membrane domain-containing protein n=1 Tax=Luteipulveratus mongoliensis TaxID=571913 RepID=UPI000697CE28|nr:glycerophosphoryl diester phosphodiesterase membrane domain-containing protein [Luteipulveratus mongoliensis]
MGDAVTNDWTSPSGDPEPTGQSQPTYDPSQQPSYGAPPPGPGFPPPPGQSGQSYGSPQYNQGQPYAGPPVGGWTPMAAKPGVIPLRALSLGDIFEGSVRTMRGNPGATLGLAFLVSLIFTLPAIALVLGLNQVDPGDNEGVREAMTLTSQQGSSVLQAIGGIALTGMLTVVLADAVLGRRMSIGGAWAKVKGRLWALIGLNLLIFLMLIGGVGLLVLVAVLVGVGLSEGFGILIAVVGGLGAVVLMIFVWVKWSFASACVVLEKQGPIKALKRSWALTQGQWWRVFGISLLAQLAAGVLSSIVIAPFALLLGFQNLSDPEALPSVGFLVGMQLVSLVVSTFTAPFIAGVTGLLYLDQRIRKEALDVTLIAAAQQQSG